MKGNKLRIFLDHARVTEKQVRVWKDDYSSRQGIYEGFSITAYITYTKLNLSKFEVKKNLHVKMKSRPTS